MTFYYTGIGSRETPADILVFMTKLAARMQDFGYTLRSGAAAGADTAFEQGCSAKQIFLPWNGFNKRVMEFNVPLEAREIASRFHPYWNSLTNGGQSLMARNVLQVLGPNMNEPSRLVICWTPDGCTKQSERTKITGGTGLAIAIADHYGVPVFNLQRQDHFNRINTMLNKS